MTPFARLSQVTFAAVLLLLGAISYSDKAFGVIWDPVPGAPVLHDLLFGLTAGVSLIAGVGLLARKTAKPAAWLIAGALTLWLCLVRLPDAARVPGIGTIWPCSKVAVIAAAAWLCVPGWRYSAWTARILYGLALIPFGVAHFLYVQPTVALIPAALGWREAWAYFTGTALVAAGLAILIGKLARLAAALSALEMALIGLIVWLPRVLAGGLGDFQRGEAVITLALSVAGWVVADSYRERRWL
jgi:uncharacterized membrane protein YphA (DoxX/SURF4 family)